MYFTKIGFTYLKNKILLNYKEIYFKYKYALGFKHAGSKQSWAEWKFSNIHLDTDKIL